MPSSSCGPFCQLANNQSISKLKFHEAAYIWTICDFTFREAAGNILYSPVFSATTNDEVIWRMQLHPKCKNENNDQDIVELFLELSPLSKQKKVAVKFKFSFLNKEQKTVHFKSLKNVQLFTLPSGNEWGWRNFCEKNESFRTEVLQDDQLTILCEIKFSQVENSEIITHHQCVAPSTKANVSTSLSKNLAAVLKSSQFSDFVLSVKGTDFPAHKIILAACSPVFAAMFQHDTKENQLNRVDIDDIEVDIVDEMLTFIYTGKCKNEISSEYAARLLPAADKYDLEELKMICVDVLIKGLSVENAAKILLLSDMHSVNELKSKSIKFITSKFTEVQNTDDWKQVLLNPQLMNDFCGDLCRRF